MSAMNPQTAQIADRLLAYLRAQRDDRGITYAAAPTRLSGGFVTAVYRFALSGPRGDGNQPLVLRLYPAGDSPARAVREGCVQNALATQGCPAPRVYHACADKSVLGGAFLVMDFLPGEPLIAAPVEQIPAILGRAHAALHRHDPQALAAALRDQGLDEALDSVDGQPGWWQRAAREHPWMRDAINWLAAHRPPGAAPSTICHGDFHPLNVLVRGSAVTGVLDWSDCRIAAPAWDVANTVLRLTMPFKHLVAPRLGAALAAVDWDAMAQAYVDAYRAAHPAGAVDLDYYRARQSIYSLIEGMRGHPVWRYPPIVRDLLDRLQNVTGIRIAMPGEEA